MKWNKIRKRLVKESADTRIEIEAVVRVQARDIKTAISRMHNELLDIDAEITDGNENPKPEIVQDYNNWNQNGGVDDELQIFRDQESVPDWDAEVVVRNVDSSYGR